MKHVLLCASFPLHVQLQAGVDQLLSASLLFSMSLKIIFDKSSPAKDSSRTLGVFITAAFLQTFISSYSVFLQPSARMRAPRTAACLLGSLR